MASLPLSDQRGQTLVMVGMMGSGKSAIGRALAEALNLGFADSDAAIEEAAAQSIAEIFARDGEAFFRKRETEVLARLLAGPPQVVSTGGGAFLRAENRAIIAEKGCAIWLDADLDTLWERVRHKDTRPLLRTSDPRATLAQLLAERAPLYAHAALRIAVEPDASIAQTTAQVLEALAAHQVLPEVRA